MTNSTKVIITIIALLIVGGVAYQKTRPADVPVIVTPDNQIQGKLPAGSTPPASAASIQSTTWVWNKTQMSDDTVIAPKKPGAFTLTLGTDGKATGKTDCNSFFATYSTGTDGVIKFENFGSTLMFCEGSQESVFTGQISQANHYMLDINGNLVLLLPMDSGSILFTK